MACKSPPPPPRPPPTGRTNLASCIVAAIFIIFLITIALIVYFTIFKPKNPKLTVESVRVPTFSTGANSTVTFTFSLYVTITNPNRAVFTHYGSSLQLLHGGSQLGFMFIPAGEIAAGSTQQMAAHFPVLSVQLSVSGRGAASVGPTETDGLGAGGFRVGPRLEMELRMEMTGRVRILHFFTHHVEAQADCPVSISAGDGSVLGFHC